MARNRDLLTDKEFFRKTCDIAEHMRNCKVEVVYWDDDNKVMEKKKDNSVLRPDKLSYLLNVATPARKGIEKFTAFNHEIGHIIMQSPLAEARLLVDEWVDYFITENNIESNDIASQDLIKETYWDMMNVLEDQRIESLMRRLWLANLKRFTKARTKIGKLHKECGDNPINIILNIRFYRDDLVKKHDNIIEYKKALDDVENTGRLGALIVLKGLKPYLDKWLKANMGKEIGDRFWAGHTPYDGSDSNLMPTEKEFLNEEYICEIIDDIDSDEEYNKELEKSKDDGTNDINNLKSSLSKISGIENPLMPPYMKKMERHECDYVIDTHLSHNLKNVFRKISEMPKSTIGYEGDEIDMESYIEGKIRGYDINHCFVDTKIDHGLSVVISIDGSQSMRSHNKMEITRNLVSTLFDCVKDYPSIDLKANVWSSNTKGDVGITNINTLEDCKYVTERNSGGFCMTPTHLALDYASRVLKTMKGRKKLIIVITDGAPQYQSWGYNISPKTLLGMNKKAVLKARRLANEMVVLSVGTDRYATNNLKFSFGRNRVIPVDNMVEGSRLIVNKFKMAVLDTLK
tara:strand:- start:2457 stop:4175 length:1719 start_codon:yes stop_codon:yes gene_type:complete